MSVLLVTYDLKKPGQDYSGFYKVFQSYTGVRLSESSYAIETNETPDRVFNKLTPFMDANDNLYIIGLHKPWMGYGPKQVNQWLEQRLPEMIARPSPAYR